MSIAGFDKERMMQKGTREGGWAGIASLLSIGIVAFLRVDDVAPWAAEYDTAAIAMSIPALVTGMKMLRNFMQEMGLTLKGRDA